MEHSDDELFYQKYINNHSKIDFIEELFRFDKDLEEEQIDYEILEDEEYDQSSSSNICSQDDIE